MYMGMARRHLNRNAARRQSGNLCDISVSRLLMLCRGQQVTGTLSVDSWGYCGRVTLTDGEIASAEFGDLRDRDAIRELSMIRDGMFTLHSQQQISLTPSHSGRATIFDSATQVVAATVTPSATPSVTPSGHRANPPPIPAMRPAWQQPPMQTASPAVASTPTMRMAPLDSQAALSASQRQTAVSTTAWTQPWSPRPAHAGGYAQAYAHADYRAAQSTPRSRFPLPSPAIGLGILCLTMLFGIVAAGL